MKALPTIELDGFSIHATFTGEVIALCVAGIADTDAQGILGDYFMKVHAEAQGRAASEVAVDIRDLTFINSNCLKAFVTWISEVSRTPQAKRYTIRIIRDKKRRWQERSFDALHRMSMSQVVLDDWDGKTP